jgi:hypothetical protein
VADEPSNGELARRLDDIARILLGLVSRAEYTADQRHTEHRFAELEHDIAEKRRGHDEDMREMRVELTKLRDETKDVREKVGEKLAERDRSSSVNFRQAIYNGIVPGIFLVITLLVTVFLAFKGGK